MVLRPKFRVLVYKSPALIELKYVFELKIFKELAINAPGIVAPPTVEIRIKDVLKLLVVNRFPMNLFVIELRGDKNVLTDPVNVIREDVKRNWLFTTGLDTKRVLN
jgi:hypothetical protein